MDTGRTTETGWQDGKRTNRTDGWMDNTKTMLSTYYRWQKRNKMEENSTHNNKRNTATKYALTQARGN